MPTDSRLLEIHRAWIGFVQPVGLVVSPPALEKAGLVPEANPVEGQERLLRVVERAESEGVRGPDEAPALAPDTLRLLEEVLGWRREDLFGEGGSAPLPPSVEVALPNYGEVLRPTWAARDLADRERVVLLVKALPTALDLDAVPDGGPGQGWQASPEAKFERLLSDSGVRVGLLTNGRALRLVYVPEHQTAGHITFRVQDMTEVGGRPILAAFLMLLHEGSVFSAPPGKRLTEVLAESRTYQNEVSNALADQVLGALWELLKGFQEADAVRGGALLEARTPEEREHVYGGLLTTLMRLVFLLYAEDQGLLPSDEVWVKNYAVAGLARRLRDDQGANPDTMDQRYGAWASLLALFRLVYHGGGHQGLRLPARKGQLFDPDAYPFLEGRPRGSRHERGARIEAPRISDGCIHRVLTSLLVLDGERLSYRALDVEQIGSVYEAMMGYVVERLPGRSLALRFHRKGSPGFVFFDLDELLATPGKERAKWLEERTFADLPERARAALRDAATPEGVLAALDRRVSPRTPRVLPEGSLVLQPGEERRRSGSHYTPRSLTHPIVGTTLRPVLEALGSNPTAEQILALKVCDPAMGSGAFLVEACRHLAERVVEAWERHGDGPVMPADETPLLHAKRLVAQRCLYGVDKNPFAVNLARLSLWLVTLARDHAFTFLDHALKCGDSLVGLDLEQIGRFHWERESDDPLPLRLGLAKDVAETAKLRNRLAGLRDDDEDQKRALYAEVETVQARSRVLGDAIVAAWFSQANPKDREVRRRELRVAADAWRAGEPPPAALLEAGASLRRGAKGVAPFHWWAEFPEVLGRQAAGFDAFVGNPPFLGVVQLAENSSPEYTAWLRAAFSNTGGKCDLVAFFFRRAFNLLGYRGTLGFIATNTIYQGDTRRSGLRQLARDGGVIYSANRRVRWPGRAAVIVSSIHLARGLPEVTCVLDGRPCAAITAFLLSSGGSEDPERLLANKGRAFLGNKVGDRRFVFEERGGGHPVRLAQGLIGRDPSAAQVIRPLLGGSDLGLAPAPAAVRYVVDFGDRSLEEASAWPEILELVRPTGPARGRWWQHAHRNLQGRRAIAPLGTVLVTPRVSNAFGFQFMSNAYVFNDKIVVFATDAPAQFNLLQSRVHEVWARVLCSTLKDDLQYTPSDCFETFPFPVGWESHPQLEEAGKAYYEFRAALMVQNDEGLTKTYNRFHDPEERDPRILRLRALHAVMDRAVLDAYGWTDLQPTCEFLLDYEEEAVEGSRRKKPWRYRWPDEFRDEVLARLLELNRVRAEQERLAGASKTRAQGKVLPLKPRKRKVRDAEVAEGPSLFGASPAAPDEDPA